MPPTGPTQSKSLLPWGIAAIVLLAAVFGYRYFTREKVEVRTAQVTRQSLVSTVSTNGKVEPVEGSEFQAHAPTAGVVKKIYVDVGDKVKPGTLLISLDDTDLIARVATAQSSLKTMQSNAQDLAQGGTTDERIAMAGDLDRAKNQQAQAAHDLAAIQSLQQRGAASANEVASAQQRLSVAQSNLHSIQQRSTGRYGESDRSRSAAQIAEAKATLAAAQSAYAAANIRSPIAGTVYAVPVSPYDFVPAGEDLLDVADLDRIQIRAYFDEPEIGRLKEGQPVSIVWEAKPGQKWHGHILRAPTTVITYGTRNVGECIITVDDAHGDLPPNSNVTVTVTTSERNNVLSLPREALHTDLGDYVYRVVNDKLVRTPIVIGVSNLVRFEIVSGLNEKDVVALNSTTNRDLTNGLEVKTVE
jgi:HlyD family secretion protein